MGWKVKKISIIYVYKFLKEASSKEHPISQLTICKALNKLDIDCNRKTVSRDINILIENGFKIVKNKGGGCYLVDEDALNKEEYLLVKNGINSLNITNEQKIKIMKKLEKLINVYIR